MRRLRVIISLIASVSLLSACNTDAQSKHINAQKSEALQAPSQNDSKRKATMEITGTLKYFDLEGGFFGFVAKDGTKYTLQGLAKEHHQNGLIMTITAEELSGVYTITQFGQVLQVHDVEIIDDSKVSPIKPAS